jgi:hypothetical protein
MNEEKKEKAGRPRQRIEKEEGERQETENGRTPQHDTYTWKRSELQAKQTCGVAILKRIMNKQLALNCPGRLSDHGLAARHVQIRKTSKRRQLLNQYNCDECARKQIINEAICALCRVRELAWSESCQVYSTGCCTVDASEALDPSLELCPSLIKAGTRRTCRTLFCPTAEAKVTQD